jgi:glycosyltransferase involved in cell wall biosynthesis
MATVVCGAISEHSATGERLMKIYFYHTQDLSRIYKEWQQGIFPGHLIYGATHLPKHGIDVYMHPFKPFYNNRLKLSVLTAWRILTSGKKYDILYASSFMGIEILILLRALRIYRRPIVIWHHQPIVRAKKSLRELVSRFFYKGIDHAFFFSDNLIAESKKANKMKTERMEMIHWGADIDFYDRVIKETGTKHREGFISTGKERRDMPTLVKAFAETKEKGAKLDIHIAYGAGKEDYKKIFSTISIPQNVKVNFINGLCPYELSKKVCNASCVVISCMPSNYTVGLTTLVEALALGVPVICTRNDTFAIDIDKEGVGITVPTGDVNAWKNAIEYIITHPDETQKMGHRARLLAERLFNLESYSAEIAHSIRKVANDLKS